MWLGYPGPEETLTITEDEILDAARDLDQRSVREFDTGATRDTDVHKLDYEGFLSPSVLVAFAEYMHSHRVQPDGSLRDSDNWQKGIPLDAYMKSMFRHFVEVWTIHRAEEWSTIDEVEALCALLFNVQGYLHEVLKDAR